MLNSLHSLVKKNTKHGVLNKLGFKKENKYKQQYEES